MSLVNQSLSASSRGDLAILSKLQQQIDFNTCFDKYGATPVHYASRTGKINCVKWLVGIAGLSGCKPANNGATPAHDAAATGQLECLQWLIECGGCSETGGDACGATPLHLAARFSQLSAVIWLVDSKQCSALDRAQNGVTPVHLAAAKGSINCLKWLSQAHPSVVNEKADNGTTPAYFAAQEGKVDCLKFLVTQADANIHLRANDGMLPIHAAAQTGHLDCLSWMIENTETAPNESDSDGATPMHFAAARGHIKILQWLLSQGCIAKTDDLGGTPLHDAAEHGQLEALKVLVASGMDIEVRDKDGLTPAELAAECGHRGCAEFLRSPAQMRRVHLNAKDYLLTERNRDSSQTMKQPLATKSDDETHPKLIPESFKKKQGAMLLSEVRAFEPVALKMVHQKKKNLQHMKLGHITSDDSSNVSVQPDYEDQPDIPLWKASLTKSELSDKQHKSVFSSEEKTHEEKTPLEVPVWKKALLKKREIKRCEHPVIVTTQPKTSTATEAKKNLAFDALPES